MKGMFMQKIVLLLMFMMNVDCLFGMEKSVYSTSINGTKITVSCDDLHKRTQRKGMQDITVLGQHEQRFLEGDINNYYYVGDFFKSNKSMLVKSPSFKAFLHICYKEEKLLINERFGGFKDCEIFKLEPEPAAKVDVDSVVIQVKEPKLLRRIIKNTNVLDQEIKKEVCLYPRIVCSKSLYQTPFRCQYFEERAHQKAKKDLGKCYKNVLEGAHELFTSEHQERSVAFPFLSSLLGFVKEDAAEVAVKSVAQFLTQDINKDKYGLIEFVVEQEEDVHLYEKYLSELSDK